MPLPRLRIAFALTLALAVTVSGACTSPDHIYVTDSEIVRWERCPALNLRMRCGTLTVPEAHDSPAVEGRDISVAFAISPASRRREGQEPVLVLLGGPGGSATDQIRGVMSDYKVLNRHRDVVLVDQRGTGRSGALHCTFGPAVADSSSPAGFLPPAHVRECVDRLRGVADLSRYLTADFVRDLELLRAALGVSQWNLHGVSYGSRVALQYAQDHPERVRSAILVGVAPPELRMPMTLGPDADAALDRLAADCSADPDCARAYPDFRAQVDSIARWLEERPGDVQVPSSRNGEVVTVPYSREMFGMTVRSTMYTGWGASNLPSMIDQAYTGDFSPLLERGTRAGRRMARSGAAGLYLAVTCGEDVARADRDSTLVQNEASTMGTARARSFFAACAEWPADPDPREPLVPGTIRAPVLMMVGASDPATPPHWAEVAMKSADNARLIVVPEGGHVLSGLNGMGCLQRLQAEFVSRPDPPALDVTCLRDVGRPPFVIHR